MDMKDLGESQGFNPFEIIHNLAIDAAKKNIRLDTKGEILLSSHYPKNTKGGKVSCLS
jgi:hypothetical protein